MNKLLNISADDFDLKLVKFCVRYGNICLAALFLGVIVGAAGLVVQFKKDREARAMPVSIELLKEAAHSNECFKKRAEEYLQYSKDSMTVAYFEHLNNECSTTEHIDSALIAQRNALGVK